MLASAQEPPEEGGSWAGPYDWEPYMVGTTCNDDEKEISHAALLPKGPYEGWVMIWRKQVDPITCNNQDTTSCWLWNPMSSNPAELFRIDQDLDSQVFCAGASWQKNGQLLVVGGLLIANSLPKRTYRFNPAILGSVDVDPSGLPIIRGSSPWTLIGDMAIERYYPTLIQLNKSTVSMPDTTNPVPGGSSLVLGGPPRILGQRGNEYWEINTPGNPAWFPAISPPDDPTNYPQRNNLLGASGGPTGGITIEEYEAKPSPATTEYLLDSYPRTFQLSSEQILIAGDVDTAPVDSSPGHGGSPNFPVNTAGSAWVIENPDVFQNPADPMWELWEAPPAEDRYYGSAVFMHTLDFFGKDRVLVFGGSRLTDPTDQGSPWFANPSVEEFIPGLNARAGGVWRSPKPPPMAKARLHLNAVILPTREILLLGGSETPHVHGGVNPMPVAEPELYDPMDGNQDTILPPDLMNPSNVAQPPNQALPPKPTPRLYHSVAVLLQDGRVLLAGGRNGSPEADFPPSLFTADVFSPPYLFKFPNGGRPVIDEFPTPVDLNAPGSTSVQFQITVTRHSAANSYDRVVLLRPAAVTHHWDMDQRYVELAYDIPIWIQEPGPSGGASRTQILHVTAPQEQYAPPGWYMLFAIERDATDPSKRVPSPGVFVRFN